MVVEAVPQALLHQKGYRCLGSPENHPVTNLCQMQERAMKWLRSTRRRGLGELASLHPEKNHQQPPDPPAHFQPSTQPWDEKHFRNIHLKRNAVLLRGCGWSGSTGQAPEQKEMRGKPD